MMRIVIVFYMIVPIYDSIPRNTHLPNQHGLSGVTTRFNRIKTQNTSFGDQNTHALWVVILHFRCANLVPPRPVLFSSRHAGYVFNTEISVLIILVRTAHSLPRKRGQLTKLATGWLRLEFVSVRPLNSIFRARLLWGSRLRLDIGSRKAIRVGGKSILPMWTTGTRKR